MKPTLRIIYLFTLGIALPLLLVEYVKPGTVSEFFGAHWLLLPLLLAPFIPSSHPDESRGPV